MRVLTRQQLGLARLDQGQQVLGDVGVVQGPGEGGIGQDQGEALDVPRMVLGQGVAVADVGVFHPMQSQVHAADAQHGVVEVVAVEEAMVEVNPRLGVAEQLRVKFAQVLADGDGEAAGADGGVAEDVPRGGRGDHHHQADDVARGAELSVLPGGGDLAEHVLVEIALGVPILHRHPVEHVHHLGQQSRRGDGETGILHVVAVGGAIAPPGAQEGEDVLAEDGEHLGGGEVLEA